MSKPLDYYSILHVRFGAEKADITASYRRLCKIYHPDISRNPDTEEIMKKINIAYAVLSDDARREEYNRSYLSGTQTNRTDYQREEARAKRTGQEEAKRASAVVHAYFSALQTQKYDRAYELLSAYDQQYVTFKSFYEWRKSVAKLFELRDFTILGSESVSGFTLREGLSSPAKKHQIELSEKNLTSRAIERLNITKHTVLERGVWRILLGYRDLNEIAELFENLSLDQVRTEKEKLWEDYQKNHCRELNLLSLSGLSKEAERELYRYKRYHQPVLLAFYRIRPPLGFSAERMAADVLESASKTIRAALRQTDLPAYIDQAVFAVVYAPLKKKYAKKVTRRMMERIKANAYLDLKLDIDVECAYIPYTGGTLKSYIDGFSEKFSK